MDSAWAVRRSGAKSRVKMLATVVPALRPDEVLPRVVHNHALQDGSYQALARHRNAPRTKVT